MPGPARLSSVLATRADNTNGLVARWAVGEGLDGPPSTATQVAQDTSGHSNYMVFGGSTVNEPCTISTPFGPGISSITTSGLVGSTVSTALFTPSLTFSGWVNPTSVSSNRGILGAGTGFPLLFLASSTGLLTFTKVGSGNLAVSSAAVPLGVWSHVAGTYDTATGFWKCFINGVLAGSGTSAQTWSTAVVSIGALSFVWVGGMRDLRVYNRALSQAEVYSLYAGSFVRPAFEYDAMAFKGVGAALTNMSAAPAAYTFTPSVAALKTVRQMAGAPSSYTFTPAAATLKSLHKLTAAPSSYTFSASSATLKSTHKILAAPSAWLFSAAAATLTKTAGSSGATQYALTAAPAAYTFTPAAAGLKTIRHLPAAPATFTFTGVSATLTFHSGVTPMSATMTAVWAAQATMTETWTEPSSMTAVWSI